MIDALTIATVTVTPALDHMSEAPHFVAGAANRVNTEQFDPGGKGIMVASFLAHFGHPMAVTGLLA